MNLDGLICCIRYELMIYGDICLNVLMHALLMLQLALLQGCYNLCNWCSDFELQVAWSWLMWWYSSLDVHPADVYSWLCSVVGYALQGGFAAQQCWLLIYVAGIIQAECGCRNFATTVFGMLVYACGFGSSYHGMIMHHNIVHYLFMLYLLWN